MRHSYPTEKLYQWDAFSSGKVGRNETHFLQGKSASMRLIFYRENQSQKTFCRPKIHLNENNFLQGISVLIRHISTRKQSQENQPQWDTHPEGKINLNQTHIPQESQSRWSTFFIGKSMSIKHTFHRKITHFHRKIWSQWHTFFAGKIDLIFCREN